MFAPGTGGCGRPAGGPCCPARYGDGSCSDSALAQDHPAPRRLLHGLCFQVHFGHYQQGSPIVPSILADSGAVAVHFRLSGLDLYGLVLAPCLLGCAGTGR